MRERLDGGLLGIAGPVTRSRDPGSIRQQPFDVDIMDSEVIPSPGAVGGEMEALGDNGRVLVSDPLQRNLEAARKSYIVILYSIQLRLESSIPTSFQFYRLSR